MYHLPTAVVVYGDENALNGELETKTDEPLKPVISLKTTPELFALYHLHIKDYKEGLTALEVIASSELNQRVQEILKTVPPHLVPQGKIFYDPKNLPQVMAQTNIKGVKIECELCGVVEQDLARLANFIELFGTVPFQQIEHDLIRITPCHLYQESLGYTPTPNVFTAFVTHVDGFNFWLVKQLINFEKMLAKKKAEKGNQPKIMPQMERKSPSDSLIEPLAFVTGEKELSIGYRTKIVYVDKPSFEDIERTTPAKLPEVMIDFEWVNYEYAVFIFAKYHGDFQFENLA